MAMEPKNYMKRPPKKKKKKGRAIVSSSSNVTVHGPEDNPVSYTHLTLPTNREV